MFYNNYDKLGILSVKLHDKILILNYRVNDNIKIIYLEMLMLGVEHV